MCRVPVAAANFIAYSLATFCCHNIKPLAFFFLVLSALFEHAKDRRIKATVFNRFIYKFIQDVQD